MSGNRSSSWTPTYSSYTPTDTQTPLSPSGYSYTPRSDPNESEHTIRHYTDFDSYTDSDSLTEPEAVLHSLDDDITRTENTLTQWSQEQSYTPSNTYTGSFTGTYSGTYTGSPSFTTLPTVRSHTPQHVDPRIRLSRITERTEESRPASGAFLQSAHRPTNPTPDALPRSTLLPGGTPSSHSRSSTDPGSDRTMPPPGRTAGLIAVFESQSGQHSRFPSAPARSASPLPSSTFPTTTGYGYGSTSYGSRPSSPSKSSGSSGSYTGTETRPTYSSMLSPPTRTGTSDYTRTGSYSDTLTRTFTNTQSGSETVTGANTFTSASYTDTGSTFTPTSSATLRRPQNTPRSPLASVRTLVSAWKDRTPAPPPAEDKPSDTATTSPPINSEGLQGIRRRFQRAGARLRESGALRPPSSDSVTPRRDSTASFRSSRSGTLPPGFDLGQFSPYTQSNEPPLYIGLLWYLNVHAAPPYRWQRCQALLYPHMLLLSWLAPGGGRGIVALDLLNCTNVQSTPSPTHPSARDDVGTVAARVQSSETDGQPLMDMLVPFHMLYADGVERLAAESLLERQKWVNRIWEAVSRPVSISDSQLTRSPTGSVRTIDSHTSSTSVGSRSTVFVPPLHSLPDIADYQSESSPLTRQLSFASSHHTGTVDDTVIQNDGYVYPGDRRVIAPSRGNSLRRTGSMTDLDADFNLGLDRPRDGRRRSRNTRALFEYSPVSVSSGSSLGKNVYITPPPSTGRGSDRPRSGISDDAGFSTSNGTRSNVSSTYYSGTEWTGTMAQTSYGTTTTSGLQTDTFTQSSVPQTSSSQTYSGTQSTSYLENSLDDSATFSGPTSLTLSRSGAVARRVRGSSRSGTSTTYTTGSSERGNGQLSSSTYTPSGSASQTFTPGTSALTPGTGTYTMSSGSYTPGSGSYSSAYTPGSNSYTGTYTPTSQSGSYTSGSRTESYTASGSGSGSYTPGSGSGSYPVSGSGSYTLSGSGSYTGSYTPGSGSGTSSGNGSYAPGSLTYGSGTYSGTYTPEDSSCSATHSFTRGSESGYDVCPSSDLTTLTQTYSSYSETITPPAPRSVASDGPRVAFPRKIRAKVSSEYLTAEEAPSDVSSPDSFKSLSTIPSLPETEFITADGGSTVYKTADEPPTPTDYYTAPQMRTPSDHGIPQEIVAEEPVPHIAPERERVRPLRSASSTPKLSSIGLWDGSDRDLQDIPQMQIPIPQMQIPTPQIQISTPPRMQIPTPRMRIPTPSEVPTIRSPQPSISDLLPHEVPLPPSESSLSPIPSFPSSSESLHVRTPSPMHQSPPGSSRPVSASETEMLPSLPESESSLETESVLTPSSFDSASDGTPRSRALPPIPQVASEPSLSTSTPSAVSPISSSPDAATPSSLSISTLSLRPSPQSTPWARETSLSYDSSVLNPSPSLRSLVVHELPEVSYDTSVLRPTASSVSSVSSLDRLSTIPPPSPLTSLVAASPLASITPVLTLPPTESSLPDVTTPSSLSLSFEISPIMRSPVQHPPAVVRGTPSDLSSGSASVAPSVAVVVPGTPSELSSGTISVAAPALPPVLVAPRAPSVTSSSSFTDSDIESSSLEISSLADTAEEGLEEVEAEVGPPPLPRDEEDIMSSISTEPSLLSSLTPSEHIRSGSVTPVPVTPIAISPRVLSDVPSFRSRSMTAPEGSGVVSMVTSDFSGGQASRPASLRTESSESVEPPRDIGRDLDRLAEDLRKYHETRGDENRGLADNLQALRDELHDLADFLRRTPSPQPPIVIQQGAPGGPRIIRTHTRGPRVIERPIIFERIPDEVPPPLLPPLPPQPPILVSQAVGSDRVITEESITMQGPVRDSTVTVVRAASNASSVSFLSSHHSDDSILDGSELDEPVAEEWDQPVPEESSSPFDDGESIDGESIEDESEISTSSFTSSLVTSSQETSTPESTPQSTSSQSTTTPSPITPVTPAIPVQAPSIATTSSLSTPATVRITQLPTEPSVDNLMDSLRGQLHDIRDQLNDLSNGQGSINRLLDMLRSRPEVQPVDNSELHDRLHRIEELMRNLIEHGRHPEPIVISAPEPPVPPPSESEPTESIITTSDSLDELRDQLRDFTPGRPPLRMPIPSQAMPSILQQLQESILSNLPPPTANRPPPLQPFVFEPRPSRPRSTSPVSIASLPPRPFTVSIPEADFYDPRGFGPSATRPSHILRQEAAARSPTMSVSDLLRNIGQRPGHRFTIPEEHRQDVDRIFGDAQRRPRRVVSPPGPIFPPPEHRAPTAPPDVGDTRQLGPSWYRPAPPQHHRTHRTAQPPVTHAAPAAPTVQPPPQPLPPPSVQSLPQQQYVPMPSGPVQVQMPPVFESLLEILRENRLAQVATVDQQRELMRYMADLNNWLARDVRDRQAEIRGVNARIENLRRDLGNMAASRGFGAYSPTVTSSSETETPATITIPGPVAPISMPEPHHHPPMPGPIMPQQPHGYSGPSVYAPVIPRDVTPSPVFTPVIPPVQPHSAMGRPTSQRPSPFMQTTPVIPIEHQYAPPPSHHATPSRRTSTPDRPFIPSEISDTEGEIRVIPPPRSDSRLNVVVQGEPLSPTSSSTHSTETYSSHRPSTHRSERSRTPRSHRHHEDRGRSASSVPSGTTRSRSASRTPRRSRTPRSSRYSSRTQTGTPRTRRSGRSRSQSSERSLEYEPPRGAPEIQVIPVPPSDRIPTHMIPGSPRHPDLQPPLPPLPPQQQQQLPPPQQQLPPQPQPPTIIIPPFAQPGVPQPIAPQQQGPMPVPTLPPGSAYQPTPIIFQSSGSISGSGSGSRRTRRSSRTRSSGRYPPRSRSRSRSRSPTRSPRRSPTRSSGGRSSGRRLRRQRSRLGRPRSRSRSRSRSYSRSWSRSPSRHHYPSTPVATIPSQPVIIHSTATPRSSRSYSPSHSRYEPVAPPSHVPGPSILLPSTGQQPAPVFVQGPDRSRTPSHRRHGSSRSRSPSYDRRHSPAPVPIIVQQPAPIPTIAPTAQQPVLIPPTIPPQVPSVQQPPIFVPSTGVSQIPQLPPQQPQYIIRTDSSSRSPSPRQPVTPITIPVPSSSRGRTRSPSTGRRRSRSYSPRYGTPHTTQMVPSGYSSRHSRRSRSHSPTIVLGDPRIPVHPSTRRDHSPRRGYSPSYQRYPSDYSSRHRPRSRSREGRPYRSRSRTPTHERRRPRSRTPDRDRHPRSLTPERDRHPRSRTPDRRHRPRSLTPERDRHPRSRTPDRRHRPHSRTSDRRPRSRTPDRRHRPHSPSDRDRRHSPSRVRSPSRISYPRYDSPSRPHTPSGRHPTLTYSHRSESPIPVPAPPTDRDHRLRPLSPERDRHPRSQTPDIHRRPRSRTPERDRHPRSRTPDRQRRPHSWTSDIPVPAPPTHPADYPESASSRPRSPIYVVPPSRTLSRASRASSHRAPTIVGFDEPEDIHPHEIRRTPSSRTPTSRRPSDPTRYSPAHSVYDDDGQPPPHPSTYHPPSHPVLPVTSRPASTTRPHSPPARTYSPDVESRSPTPSSHSLTGQPRPPLHPYPIVEGRETPVPLSRRPSERRPVSPHVPSEYAEHEAPRRTPHITESDAGRSGYESPLPVPPRRISVVHPPPRHRAATPIDLQDAEYERERHERLGAIERHLHDVALAATQAEDERETEFRRNEEHRERIFLESQERRELEDRERTEHLWNTIQNRIEAIPPPRELSDRPASTRPSTRPHTPSTPRVPETPIPAVHPEAPRPSDSESFSADRASIKSVVEGVASRHADDILETVRLEREEFTREREAATAERERLMNEAEESRRQLYEQQEARIKALEDELAAVKDDLQNERQAKLAEEADIRERERSEFLERDEILRAQLNDITNLLQDNRDLTHQKKMDSDNRYAEKAERRQNKDYQIIELRDMVQKIHDDLQAEIQRATDERIQAQSKPTLESIVEELQRQNAEQRELLKQLSEDWRNDCERHHRETIDAVKSTAQEQVPFNVQGYLDEFSKALAAEVRMLLGEVGKLREERRNLQHEMGFLLCMKSKYGPGGEFQPDWHPPSAVPPQEPPAPPPDAPMPPDLPPPAAKPGWRQIGKRRGKKKGGTAAPPQQVPPAPPIPSHHMDPRRQVTQSWATWLPDPNQAPTPPSIEPSLTVPRPSSPGLFGPRTPSNKSWVE